MEIIEYKSSGHPDTLTDMIVEACASGLDRYYKKEYGKILHYNVDKAIFLAGDVSLWFGGGEIKKKPKFILGGQVSNLDYKLRAFLKEIIKDTIKLYLPNLLDFSIDIQSNNVAQNLSKLCIGTTLANDTSFGVGYYPYSEKEQMVLNLRDKLYNIINSQFIPLGELFKIMLTGKNVFVSAPFYANKVKNVDEYLYYKIKVQEQLKGFGDVIFNPDTDSGSYYMTLCGSSIECGDDGQVGRGNRYNGLITPCRPMTLEAYHGKNNRNHTGKLYSKLAFEIAKERHRQTGKYTEIVLVSVIGKPITEYELYILKGD